MKVFVVEDSPIIVARLITLLQDIEDIEISGMATTAEAASIGIAKLHPDVVILDIVLVNGTGIDVLRTLKRESHSPAVIMLTNHTYPQYRDICEELGAEYFLDKSTEFEKVGDLLGGMSNLANAMADRLRPRLASR